MAFRKAVKKRQDSRSLLLFANLPTISARAFTADIDDVRPGRDVASRSFNRSLDLERSVTGKRIVGDVDDAHDQRAPREGNRAPPQTQDHRSTSIRWRFSNRQTLEYPARRARSLARSKRYPTSSGACASELIRVATP